MTYPSYASPDSAPSPEGSPPVESADEPIAPADDPHASLLQLPWCQTCGPFIRMLFSYARERAQLQGRRTGTAAEMLPQSPFADYVVVPALVHRSQLASSEGYTSIDSSNHPSPAATSSMAQTMHEEQMGTPTIVQRKTRGVKIACTNCRRVSKRCDEGRPCTRCLSHGLADTCANASPKPRRRALRHAAATVAAAAGSPAHSVSTLGGAEGTLRMTFPYPSMGVFVQFMYLFVPGTSPPAVGGSRDPILPEVDPPWAASALGIVPAETGHDHPAARDVSELLDQNLGFPVPSNDDSRPDLNWAAHFGPYFAQTPFATSYDWSAMALTDRAGPAQDGGAHPRPHHY
ncbi:hypothetical protein ONZ51_g963 [Trametes cubensis]|uniref:Transcription activator of gluconeogenesis ERT1 n=1 Tax=Trametes cubensis TaxID=1111947 RepID=A0AAD7U4N6_9APHY|nr:hypothetical protein ONZ51_g963 [Trametes cubensis]